MGTQITFPIKLTLPKKYAEAGYDVVGLDLKGFGRSGGTRCYIKRVNDLIE